MKNLETPFYKRMLIAAELGISDRQAKRIAASGDLDWVTKTASYGNACGRAWAALPSSIAAFKAARSAQRSDACRQSATIRWHADGVTDVSSGSSRR